MFSFFFDETELKQSSKQAMFSPHQAYKHTISASPYTCTSPRKRLRTWWPHNLTLFTTSRRVRVMISRVRRNPSEQANKRKLICIMWQAYNWLTLLLLLRKKWSSSYAGNSILHVCLFVVIKPETLYFAPCVWREVITPGNGCRRNQAQKLSFTQDFLWVTG